MTELRELTQLEEENARLKRVVARSDARSAHPAGGAPKKGLKPARRRELARWIHERFQVSVKRACRLALLQRGDLVPAKPGEGSDAAAHAHSRHCLCASDDSGTCASRSCSGARAGR